MDVDRAAAMLADLGRLWQEAGPADRKEIVGRVFSAVYRDPDHPQDIVILLNPALHPLWGALPGCINWVIDGA